MTKYVERKLSNEELREFEFCLNKGYEILGIIGKENTPESIVEKVDKYVDDWQKRKRGILSKITLINSDVIDTALALGIVWGFQVVKVFKWKWVCIIEGKHEYYGVVSVDRSMVLYPTYFIRSCLENSRADCTAMLSFNMMKSDKIPKFQENEYKNLLESIHRIVPKG
jgi:hypothetical protein